MNAAVGELQLLTEVLEGCRGGLFQAEGVEGVTLERADGRAELLELRVLGQRVLRSIGGGALWGWAGAGGEGEALRGRLMGIKWRLRAPWHIHNCIPLQRGICGAG